MANCFQADGSFPLREKLMATDRFWAYQPSDRVYSTAGVPGISRGKIVYFASSVFWRAAVHEWRLRGEIVSAGLGLYEDALRRFLMGEAPFPSETCVLLVRVSAVVRLLQMATFPTVENMGGFRQHRFIMLGMDFRLAVGKRIPDHYRELCHAHSQGAFVIISENLDIKLYSSLASVMMRHPDPRRK
jgi:hypothetical protein